MKCDRKRAWKVHFKNVPDYITAYQLRDELMGERVYCKPNTLKLDDKPVKIKARPNGTFDVKVLVSDEPVKKDKNE